MSAEILKLQKSIIEWGATANLRYYDIIRIEDIRDVLAAAAASCPVDPAGAAMMIDALALDRTSTIGRRWGIELRRLAWIISGAPDDDNDLHDEMLSQTILRRGG